MHLIIDGVKYDMLAEDVARSYNYDENYVRLLARQGKLEGSFVRRGRMYLFNRERLDVAFAKMWKKSPAETIDEDETLDDVNVALTNSEIDSDLREFRDDDGDIDDIIFGV